MARPLYTPRLPFLLLGLGLAAAPVAAQTPRVRLTVALSPDSTSRGARLPWIQVHDLLADRTWSEALDQAFPIRLEFRLEIWRSRVGWVDNFERATEWSVVIQREPLQDVYRVTRIVRSGPEDFRFATRDDLDRWVRQVIEPEVEPSRSGTFYYSVQLRISALSDEEMEELERFLSGADPDSPRRPPSSLGRSIRRFLLRVAGMPLQDLEARSEPFTVR
ncbi:MAG TPA: DUF4390 domain-containing protein [Gemmatimonadales bacterium]|nr:DUF4390 domain-containing protein [Gemmatimonadales bacterium]